MSTKSSLPNSDNLVALYVSGKTINDLSSTFHADTRTIKSVLISQGVTLRPQGKRASKPRPEWFETAIARYQTGEGLNNLAIEYHIRPSILKQWFQEKNIVIRTFAEGAKIAIDAKSHEWRKDRNKRVSNTLISRSEISLPIDKIIERYMAGESENAIAKSYSVSRNVIRARLRQSNITMRNSTLANRLMMSKRTPEENLRNTLSANIAKTGKKESIEAQEQRARTRQERLTHVSPAELLINEWLKRRGVDAIPQMAVGPYNVDLGTSTVAVEIFGGGWHGFGEHMKRAPERHSYLFDRGFNLIIIWVDGRKWPLKEVAADYVASFIQIASSNPTIRGQYRVIWGDGKEVPPSSLNLKHLALVPSRRTANYAGS